MKCSGYRGGLDDAAELAAQGVGVRRAVGSGRPNMASTAPDDTMARTARELRKRGAVQAVGALVRAALQAIDAHDFERARRLLAGVLRALGEHPATPSRLEARGQP